MSSQSITSHIRVTLREENVGIGYKTHKEQQGNGDDDCFGLDAFQRILGKLNGKAEEIEEGIEKRRIDNFINGKWGINFIKGDVLRSTWDSDENKLKNKDEDDNDNVNDNTDTSKDKKKTKKVKKRKREDTISNNDTTQEDESKKKRHSKDKKDKKKTSKNDLDKKKSKSKGSKKDISKEDKDHLPKEKMEKKEKKEKHSKKDKKEKKDKKSKDEKKLSSENDDKTITAPPSTDSNDQLTAARPVVSSRLAVRRRYIAAKRAATMDQKSLNEIFMIK